MNTEWLCRGYDCTGDCVKNKQIWKIILDKEKSHKQEFDLVVGLFMWKKRLLIKG